MKRTPELSSLKPRGNKMLLQRRSTYDSITTVEPIKISEKKSIIQQPEVKDPIKSVDQKSDSRELMKVNIHEEKLEKKPQLLQQTQKTENINSQLIKDTFGLLSEQLNCNKKNSEKPNIPNNIFKENTFLLSPLKPSNSEITIQSSKSPTNELIKDTFGLLSEQLKNDKINVPEKINTNNSLKDLNRLLSTIDLCEFKPQQQNSTHAFTKNTRLNKKNKKSLLKISGRTAKKHNKAVYKERNNNGMLKKIFNMDKLDSTTTKLITATFKPLSEQSKLITLNSPKAADSTGCLKDLAKFLSSVEKHGNRTKTKLENYFNTPQIMKSKKINTFKTSKTSLNKLNYNDENTKKLDKSTSETTAKVLKETFAPFHMSLGLGPDPNENQESSSHVKCLSDGIDRTPFVDRQSAILVAKKSNRPIWKTCLNNDRNWKNKRKKFIDNTITEKSFNDLAEKIQSKPINIIKKQQHSRLKSTSSMDDLLFIPPKTAKKFYYSAKVEESYQPNPNPVIKVPIRSSQAKQTPLPYWMEQVNMDELEKSLTKKPKWWFLDSIKSKNMFFPFKFGNVTVLKTKKSNPKNLDNDTKNYKKKVYKEKERSHSTNTSNKEDNRFWTTDVYKRKPREIHKSKGKLQGSNIRKSLMKLKKPKFIVAKPSLTIRKRKKSQIKPLSMVMETLSYKQEKNIRQMYPPLKTYRKNGDKISEEKKPKTVKLTENSTITQKVKEIKPAEVIILNHAANDEDNQNNCDKNDWSILPEDMENEWKEFQKTKSQSDLNKVHSCVNEFYKEVEEYPIPKKLEHDKKNNIIELPEDTNSHEPASSEIINVFSSHSGSVQDDNESLPTDKSTIVKPADDLYQYLLERVSLNKSEDIKTKSISPQSLHSVFSRNNVLSSQLIKKTNEELLMNKNRINSIKKNENKSHNPKIIRVVVRQAEQKKKCNLIEDQNKINEESRWTNKLTFPPQKISSISGEKIEKSRRSKNQNPVILLKPENIVAHLRGLSYAQTLGKMKLKINKSAL